MSPQSNNDVGLKYSKMYKFKALNQILVITWTPISVQRTVHTETALYQELYP